MKTILSKAQFAEHVGRSRPCISGWIKAGKVSCEALIGNGREAKIWVERAKADLAASLDPSQQAAQAAPIVIESTEPPSFSVNGAHRSATAPVATQISERERDLARRAKADADKAEHDAEAARRKLALDEGRYVLAEEAAAAWGREISKFISDTELFIGTTLPQATAERHNLDWRVLASDMREAWRAFRANCSGEARARRQAIEWKSHDPS